MKNSSSVVNFISESNRIEGILRAPTDAEIEEYYRFMALDIVTIEELIQFVSVYQPDAVLRDRPGLDVQVGGYIAPRGGPEIRERLQKILETPYVPQPYMQAYYQHVEYETLHPFTDGNGRSGRMLWAWQLGQAPKLGFLHTFYYQTLKASHG